MILRYSAGSPYARKVRVAAIETGLDGRIEGIASNPWDASDELKALNPLGKVPTLVTDDGVALYDSPVICDYFDTLHAGRKLIPAAGPARWLALRLQALADGIMDAAVLWRVEVTQRKDHGPTPGWIERQRGQIERALDRIEEQADGLTGAGIGEISVACALGYLDFRHGGLDWRAGRPKLRTWFAAFAKRPSMAATHPGDAK